MKLLATIVFFIIFTVALIFSLALTIELFAGIVIGLLVAAIHILKLQSQYSKLVKQSDQKS